MVVAKSVANEFRSALADENINIEDEDIRLHIVALRARLSETAKHVSHEGQINSLIRVLKPLYIDLRSWCLGKGMDSETRSDLLWRLYAIAVSGTKGSSKLSLVAEDQDSWNDAMVVLDSTTDEPELAADAARPSQVNQ